MLDLCHGRTFEGHGVTFLHLCCRGTLISYLVFSSAVFCFTAAACPWGISLVTYDVLHSLVMRCSHISSHFYLDATPLFTLGYLPMCPSPLFWCMLQSDPCLSSFDLYSTDRALQPPLQPFCALAVLVYPPLFADVSVGPSPQFALTCAPHTTLFNCIVHVHALLSSALL